MTVPTANEISYCNYTFKYSPTSTGVTFTEAANEVNIDRSTAISGASFTITPEIFGWQDTGNKQTIKIIICELTSDYSPVQIVTYQTSSTSTKVETLTLPSVNDAASCTFTHDYSTLPTGITVTPGAGSDSINIDRSTTALGDNTFTVTPKMLDYSGTVKTITVTICSVMGSYSPSEIVTYRDSSASI